MTADRSFRVLHHLTLALAGICLVVAEWFYLPGASVILVAFLLLVLAAFLVEGRWGLSVAQANLLGVLIAAGGGWWLVAQVRSEETWTSGVPVSAALVPFLGPLLMLLLVVKLFRPREPGDFWLLQGVGLLMVGLGCVLNSGVLLGGALLAYLACALACLGAHHGLPERPEDETLPTSGWGWARFGLRWAALAAALALPLFLATPRGSGPEWDPLDRFGLARERVSAVTGFSEEIDLGRSGQLGLSSELAFTVTARTPDRRLYSGLPANQRWRGVVLDGYQGGVWTCLLRTPSTGLIFRPRQEPDAIADPVELTFTVPIQQAKGLFLAEPVVLGERAGALPVTALGRVERRQPALFFETSGTVLPYHLPLQGEIRYQQLIPRDQDRHRYPAVRVRERYRVELLRLTVPELRVWTANLLRKLVRQPRPAAPGAEHARSGVELPDGEEGVIDLHPAAWEATARLLSDYLAHSGDYTYSLDLRRQDETLDPVVDFLRNTRQGHCERYAAALALMLRALGIPARIVKGFRGCETDGEGSYVVRDYHAHAWVEALVPDGPIDNGTLAWLILDPTPDGAGPPAGTFSLVQWVRDRTRDGQEFWEELIVGYSASRQADLWSDLRSGRLVSLLALVVAGVAGLFLWRTLRRRRAARRGSYFDRLVHLLAGRGRKDGGLLRQSGETPREYADRASAHLREQAGLATFADLPQRLVTLVYRDRFGGRPLLAEERAELNDGLRGLAAALAKVGG